MTFASGGQRSIQLSYGCLSGAYNTCAVAGHQPIYQAFVHNLALFCHPR